MTNLAVRNVRRPAYWHTQEGSIPVTFDEPAVLNGTAARYTTSIYPGGQSFSGRTVFVSVFSGLTAGTRHNVTVTTTIRKDDYGQATVEYNTPVHVFYTSE